MTQFSPTGARNIEQKIGEEVARYRMQMVKIPLLEWEAYQRFVIESKNANMIHEYQEQVIQEMIDNTTRLFRCKALNPTQTGVYK